MTLCMYYNILIPIFKISLKQIYFQEYNRTNEN